MKNPSLREQPRSQVAPVMEPRKNASIIAWLENSGRMMEPEELEEKKADRKEDEEINALMSGDDFNLDDDEDEDDDDDDS